MKTKLLTLKFLLAFCLLSFSSHGVTFFKIKLTDGKSAQEVELLNRVQFNKYINLNGNCTYYLKEVFSNIFKAEKSLKNTRDMGFTHASIVVLQNNQLLSGPISKRHIELAKKRAVAAEKRNFYKPAPAKTIQPKRRKVKKFVPQSSVVATKKKKKVLYRKSELEAKKKAEEARKLARTKALNDSMAVVKKQRIEAQKAEEAKKVERKAKEEKEAAIKEQYRKEYEAKQKKIAITRKVERKKLEELVETTIDKNIEEEVKDIIKSDLNKGHLNRPLFRIQLLEASEVTEETKSRINSVKSAVKVHERRYTKVYTVEFHDTALAAEIAMKKYQDLGFDLKVVGDYKSVIISKDLANQIVKAL